MPKTILLRLNPTPMRWINFKIKLKSWLVWSKLKYMILLIIFFLSSFYLLFLVKSGLDKRVLIDNTRYFFSAAAQSLAALIALIFVIYNLVSLKISNYELIFKQHYPQFLTEYHNLNTIKKLIILSGITIVSLLVSLLFIFDNLYMLLVLILFNLFLLYFSVLDSLHFFLHSLSISGKDKFFEDAKKLLENKVHYDILVDVRNNIEEFNELLELEDYSYIKHDKQRINLLFSSILVGFGKQLKNEECMGDSHYYDEFTNTLEMWAIKKELYEAYQPTFYSFRDNFKSHISMCINDEHCIKYIPELINIVVKMLDVFNRINRHNMYESYLKLFQEIQIQIKNVKDPRVNLKYCRLSELADSIAKNALNNYDLFIKLLYNLKLSKKLKIGYLQEIVNKFKYYYGKNLEEVFFQQRLKELKINKYEYSNIKKDTEHYLEIIHREINKLKNNK
ncbi:hypothetical protein HYX00_00910 [Candidatus Woesearchaeota archaeon]|nr:hypothetical protein [Candidatus Woesearchaeota archaeon]